MIKEINYKNKKNRIKLFERTFKKWTPQSQLKALQDEATGLALTAGRFSKIPDDKNIKHLAAYIADTEIMLDNIKNSFPILANISQDHKFKSLQRLHEMQTKREEEILSKTDSDIELKSVDTIKSENNPSRLPTWIKLWLKKYMKV